MNAERLIRMILRRFAGRALHRGINRMAKSDDRPAQPVADREQQRRMRQMTRMSRRFFR